jgi:hypothetical protein
MIVNTKKGVSNAHPARCRVFLFTFSSRRRYLSCRYSTTKEQRPLVENFTFALRSMELPSGFVMFSASYTLTARGIDCKMATV